MSNRGGRDGGRDARGNGRGRGRSTRGRTGRGKDYSANIPKQRGLCAALGEHVFDYGQKGAADQSRTTWEKIVHHVGTIHGHDISNELLNRTEIPIPKPQYSQATLDQHADAEKKRGARHSRVQSARKSLASQLQKGKDSTKAIELATILNEIEEADENIAIPLPIKLEGNDKSEYDSEWRTYRERSSTLEKQRGQAFSMIRGQCMQVLLDKMKYDTNWTTVSSSSNPLFS
jgi:hypothetical protein